MILAAVGVLLLAVIRAASGSVSVEPSAAGAQNVTSCSESAASESSFVVFNASCDGSSDGRIPLIVDTDTNNEIDDQVAIAYALLNSDTFDVRGITTNDTGRGGPIARHTAEAQYVVDIAGLTDKVKVYSGVSAAGKFNGIRGQLNNASYDGQAAIEFIVSEAQKYSPDNKLVIAPVGKITNVALALAKDPSIADKIIVRFLGGNYTTDGSSCPIAQDCESNIFQDGPAVNFILDGTVEFEMYPAIPKSGQGSASIKISGAEAAANFAGRGPDVGPKRSPHGQTHSKIGDFINWLWVGPANGANRPMYDTAPMAMMINPDFGTKIVIGAPTYNLNRSWTDRPNNPRKIAYWDFLKANDIESDIFRSFASPALPN